MPVIAIANQKGGTGKTTVAVNLAAGLGRKKKKVLLIDLDPEGHASSWSGISEGEDVSDVLLGAAVEPLLQPSTLANVDVLPSTGGLTGIEFELARKAVPQTLLKKALRGLPEKWDFVLIDCPGDGGLLTLNALTAATHVLVPVMPHAMDINGLAGLGETIEEVKEDLNASLELLGVVVCRVRAHTKLAKDACAALRSTYGRGVFKTEIGDSVRLAEAPGHTRSIFEHAKKSKSAKEFTALTTEFLRRVV